MSQINCWLESKCTKLHCEDPNGCLIRYKLDFLFDQANISQEMRKPINLYADSDGTDLDKFIQLKKIQENITEFVNNGNQLYIYSKNCGCGKTSWSLKLVQSYFFKIWLKSPMTCRALFISVPTFLLALKDNITTKSDYIAHIKKHINTCDIVIWDDISNKIGTEFEISNLLSMIDTRINNGKANIYTSNISPTDLGKYLDIRLGSRIANASRCIELNGADKRGIC